MFRKIRYELIALLFISLLVIAGCSSSSNSSGAEDNDSKDAEYTLVYSDHDPPGAMRTKFLEEVWFKEIEEQTDHKVKIEANFGGSLLDSQEIIEGVQNNVVDMGHIFPDFYPSELYSFQIFRLFPKGPQDWEGIHGVYERAFEEVPILKQELEDLNQVPLLVTAGLPSVLDQPINLMIWMIYLVKVACI